MTRWRTRMLFILILSIGGLVLIQMIFYLIHLLFNINIDVNIFQYCLQWIKENSKGHVSVEFFLIGFLGYTLMVTLWKIGRQAILTYNLKNKLGSLYLKRWDKNILLLNSEDCLAFTMGLFRPQIVLSKGIFQQFDEHEIEAIILHEEYHLKHYDPLKIFIVTVLSDGMAYIPVMKELLYRYKTYTELLADQYAMEKMGTTVKLGSALLKLIKQKSESLSIVTAPFAENAVNLRIKQILDPHTSIEMKSITRRSIISSVGIMAVLSTMVLGGCT